MIDGIISGVLVLPPKRLFTRRASPYVIGKIDVMAVRQDGQPVHGNVIAFDAGVCTALLAMSKGDTVSLLIRQLNIEMFMQHTSPSDL
jgi:hypothetical protein